MAGEVNRRDFLSGLGITMGATMAAAGTPAVAGIAWAQDKPKGNIPDKPFRIGHMTFFTGPAAVLGEPMYKGQLLAAEEINAAGGLLGKRKIETIVADEAAGPDANVKEVKRMKLSEGIDWLTGIIAVHNQMAVSAVAEELKIPTLSTEMCGDMIFEKVIPNAHYVFGMGNVLSADGVSCVIAIAKAWPGLQKIAVIHPDYGLGRWFHTHFTVAMEKLLPGAQVVSEGWVPLGTMDFSAHISKVIALKADLLVTILWGGMYVAFYKQALRHGLYNKMKVCSALAYAVAPHTLGQDYPEGVLAGVHSNYRFTYPPGHQWPLNKQFIERYRKRWSEYPTFLSEQAYSALYFLQAAVEKANRLTGGWPDIDAIIDQLEGLSMATPAGYVYIRREDHRAFKDVVMGFSKHVPEYPFPVWDPDRIITMPIRNLTAPPNWPKPGQGHNDASATANWIKETWPKASA